MDDIDFKAKVSRQEFEELCSDLFQRVAGPVQQALSSAQISLVGAGVRRGWGSVNALPDLQRIGLSYGFPF